MAHERLHEPESPPSSPRRAYGRCGRDGGCPGCAVPGWGHFAPKTSLVESVSPAGLRVLATRSCCTNSAGSPQRSSEGLFTGSELTGPGPSIFHEAPIVQGPGRDTHGFWPHQEPPVAGWLKASQGLHLRWGSAPPVFLVPSDFGSTAPAATRELMARGSSCVWCSASAVSRVWGTSFPWPWLPVLSTLLGASRASH